jgi:Transposase
MATVLCRQTASFSPAALDAPRPATGVRRMPHRGPNHEAPATALSPCVDQDGQRLEAAVLFTGWDWASAGHAVTILDAAGEVVDHRVCAHTEQDLDTMLARLASHGRPAELPVAIERADGLVVDRLLAAGHPVVAIDPGAFHAARPRWVPPAPRPTRVTATSSRTTCAPTATGCAGSSRRTQLPASCKRWSGCATTRLPPRPRPA